MSAGCSSKQPGITEHRIDRAPICADAGRQPPQQLERGAERRISVCTPAIPTPKPRTGHSRTRPAASRLDGVLTE